MALEGVVLGGATLVAAFGWLQRRRVEREDEAEDFAEPPRKKQKTSDNPLDLERGVGYFSAWGEDLTEEEGDTPMDPEEVLSDTTASDGNVQQEEISDATPSAQRREEISEDSESFTNKQNYPLEADPQGYISSSSSSPERSSSFEKDSIPETVTSTAAAEKPEIKATIIVGDTKKTTEPAPAKKQAPASDKQRQQVKKSHNSSTSHPVTWEPKSIDQLREDQDHASINYGKVKGFWESESRKEISAEERGRKRKRENGK